MRPNIIIVTVLERVTYYIAVSRASGFFFWARCCGLRQFAANCTVAAVVYGPVRFARFAANVVISRSGHAKGWVYHKR